MSNDYIIQEITDYIDNTVYHNLENAQKRFAKALTKAMESDGYQVNYDMVYNQIPHAYWEITNMGDISGEDDIYLAYARDELKDILLGKKKYDINQVTFTVEGSYETRDLTADFKDVYQLFQKSKKKTSNTATGLAVEELVGEELNKNWRTFSDPIAKWVTENLQIKQEGAELKPGDFKIGKDNKLIGHIDIKYSTKGPENKYRYRNMIKINETNDFLPVKDIAKLIEGSTYHGFKNRNNMVLIYVYPDDGYWGTYVLAKVKDTLVRDLRRASNRGYDLSKSTAGQLWYGQLK